MSKPTRAIGPKRMIDEKTTPAFENGYMDSPAPKYRVGFVIDDFGIGGAERCIAHLANLLDPLSFQPLVFCLKRNGSAAQWVTRNDVPIIELHKRQGNDPSVVFRLSRAIRRNLVDIVQSHNWSTLVETAIARRLAGARCHVHVEQGTVLGGLSLTPSQKLIRGTLARWSLRSASATVAVAEATRSRLTELTRFPSESVRLIPNGVLAPPVAAPLVARRQIRQSLGIDEPSLVVGSVGRLDPVKGFEVAIKATAIAISRGVQMHFVLVGDGPERQRLLQVSKDEQVGDFVHFVGEQMDIGDWLSAMDIYVNSSHSEGTSLSIMEAMASGLPSVVTDVGDNARLISGEASSGLVVPPRHPTKMAEALQSLTCEAHVRQRFGDEARQRHAAYFSAEVTTRRYSDLYLSLLSGDGAQ